MNPQLVILKDLGGGRRPASAVVIAVMGWSLTAAAIIGIAWSWIPPLREDRTAGFWVVGRTLESVPILAIGLGMVILGT